MKRKSIINLILIIAVILAMLFVAVFGYNDRNTLSARNIRLGLELKGGVSILYEADIENPSESDMNAAVSMIRERLDRQGYMDASVSVVNGNRLLVEIPGVEDSESAIANIGASAELYFMGLDGTVYVKGDDVASAKMEMQQNQAGINEPIVLLNFNDAGRKKFAEGTKACIGSQLLIMLDDQIISAPSVSEEINSDSAVISGSFTTETATELADLINAGALPFKLNVIESHVVGATLGIDALRTSVIAGGIGLILVAIFMLVIYRMFGFVANIALIMFVSMELIAINAFDITLTLTGIAGIILSIGMAVDANIIIFERIKEEVKSGRTVRVAVKNGFARAFPAILDGNLTTLLAAVILFYLGSGTIKGFAQTLGLGILISMFTALVVTRLLVTNLVNAGVNDKKYYGIK